MRCRSSCVIELEEAFREDFTDLLNKKLTSKMFLDIVKLNRGVGLRRYLSPTYNAVLSSLPRQLNNHSHMVHLTLATYMKAGWVTSHKWPL